MNMLHIIGRTTNLFEPDLNNYGQSLSEAVRCGRFLVIGGAGSIGQAVVKEIFSRDPLKLHVVDINENNLVELVRDIRSSLGYGSGDFGTYAIDCGSREFDVFFENEGPYDYILNLSALKHVRSEKDPYTIMRMVDVNIFNTIKTLRLGQSKGVLKYFCVSTDKAANPVNMMGASKRIMELFLMRESLRQTISMARFANVAFSDGSLLYGFNQRILKRQPLAAPCDVKRYFITPQESGELCLISCLMGDNRDILFPKISDSLRLTTFSEIAQRYLHALGYEPYLCNSEDEARSRAEELINKRKWPCYFFESDTTGEKEYEEFFMEGEDVDMSRFDTIGVIRNKPIFESAKLDRFESEILRIRSESHWTKQQILALFCDILPEFKHKETGRYLDQRM